MGHVINEMEKNVQESLLLSEIIFTSILPLAITVSSPEFRNSEFFLHQIKSKNNKNKTELQPQGKISYHYRIILLLLYFELGVIMYNFSAIQFVSNKPRLFRRLSTYGELFKIIPLFIIPNSICW